jgi:hypothetical protein
MSTTRNSKVLPNPKDGKRMPAFLWVDELAKDPFCSRTCCEVYHGLYVIPSTTCPECGSEFEPSADNPSKKVYCSQRCVKRASQRRVREGVRAPYGRGFCSECGADHDRCSIGCKTCADRRRRRQQRTHCPNGHEYTDETIRVDVSGRRYCLICVNSATTCRRGHPFTEENSRIKADGHRHCRVCSRIVYAQNREKQLREAA